VKKRPLKILMFLKWMNYNDKVTRRAGLDGVSLSNCEKQPNTYNIGELSTPDLTGNESYTLILILSKMYVITKKAKMESVAQTFRAQYHSNMQLANGKYTDDMYKDLVALNSKTESAIDEIMGNHSWTTNNCNECSKDSDVVIQIGKPEDYESSTAWICRDCLSKAIAMIDAV